MEKQERRVRQMDRDLPGAVIVINTDIVDGDRTDTAGPVAVSTLDVARIHVSEANVAYCRESFDEVVVELKHAVEQGARVIVTVGGTGIAVGDIAPEATANLLEVQMDGIVQQIRDNGLRKTPLASLSRGLVGVTHRGPGGVLIVNAPGSRGGVEDSLEVVCPLLPHIFEQLDDLS